MKYKILFGNCQVNAADLSQTDDDYPDSFTSWQAFISQWNFWHELIRRINKFLTCWELSRVNRIERLTRCFLLSWRVFETQRRIYSLSRLSLVKASRIIYFRFFEIFTRLKYMTFMTAVNSSLLYIFADFTTTKHSNEWEKSFNFFMCLRKLQKGSIKSVI